MNQQSPKRETCAGALRRLDEHLNRALAAGEAGEVDEHLRQCAACGKEAEVREQIRLRLQQAVRHSSPAPPYLAEKIRARIRTAPQPAVWLPRLAAAAAVLAICIGVGAAYQLGYLRLTAGAREAYIAKIAAMLPEGLRPGISDHIHCAVFQSSPRRVPTLDEAARSLGPKYRELVPVVRRQVPDAYRLVLAHECKYRGRTFVHLVLKDDSRTVSLVVTPRQNGESLRDAKIMRTLNRSGDPVFGGSAQRFSVAAIESGGFLVYVVSDLPSEQNTELMVRLAGDVGAYLKDVEG